jgi:hypothetical protein
MSKHIKYTPDDDVRVHSEGAIKLICAAFQSHDKGLPEWAKNSADEYARRNAELSDRIVFFSCRTPSAGTPQSLGVSILPE